MRDCSENWMFGEKFLRKSKIVRLHKIIIKISLDEELVVPEKLNKCKRAILTRWKLENAAKRHNKYYTIFREKIMIKMLQEITLEIFNKIQHKIQQNCWKIEIKCKTRQNTRKVHEKSHWKISNIDARDYLKNINDIM